MRSQATLDWKIPEIDEAQWQELVRSEHSALKTDATRQRVLRAIGVASLALLFIFVTCTLLNKEAQRGLTRIEQDMDALVAVEAVQHTNASGITEHAQVAEIDLDWNGAMVRVVVTKTAESDAPVVQHETRFYTRVGSGWRRSAPLMTFWGKPATLDTERFHLEFYTLDESVVRAAAAKAECQVVALLASLGIDPISAGERFTVEIVPPAASRRLDNGATTIVLESPTLCTIREGESPSDRLSEQICVALGERAYDRLMGNATVLPAWKPLTGYLQRWLAKSHLAAADPVLHDTQQSTTRTTEPTRAPLYELTSDPRRLYPGALLVSSDADRRANGMAFIDFVAASCGEAAIPRLLCAIEHCTDWEELASELFGLPLAEVETRFGHYLCAHSTAAGSLADAQERCSP